MILSNCPRCGESLRVPEVDLPDDAYAQCPWCSETFPASEINDRLPPVVQLFDAHGQTLAVSQAAVAAGVSETTEANPFAAPEIEHEPAGYEEVPAFDDQPQQQGYFDDVTVEDEAAPAVDIQVAGPEESVAPPDRRPMRVQTKKTARKKGSPVKTLIGVALGPVLALPIAAVILWAWGKPLPNLGFWPFDGTVNRVEKTRAAAPPSTRSPSTRSRTTIAQKPVGGSLLDSNSAVAKAAQQLSPSSNGQDTGQDTGPELLMAPEQLPTPDNAIAEVDIEIEKPDGFSPRDAMLSDILGEETPGKADQEGTLEMPQGAARYPGDTQAASTKTDIDDGSLSPPKSTITLAPSDVEVTDVQPQQPVAARPAGEDRQESATKKDPKTPVASEPADTAGLKPPKVSLTLPPELAKPAESEELLASIKKASDRLTKLHQKRANSTNTKNDLAFTYVDIAEVGTLDASPDSEALSGLLSEVSKSPAVDDLSIAGPQWWKLKSRLNNGMLVIGNPTGGNSIIIKSKSGEQEIVPLIFPDGVSMPNSDRVIAIGLITSSDGQQAVQVSAIGPLP